MTSSGLYYYGYRFYDPNLQRWLNRDPLGAWDGPNFYAFLLNSPIDRIDPFGFNGFPVDFVGPLLPGDIYGPLHPDPLYRPPGWNPSWPEGTDARGMYSQDPVSGEKWYPHGEDNGHWPHYDNTKRQSYPANCVKPWPGQRRRFKPSQSTTNPWRSGKPLRVGGVVADILPFVVGSLNEFLRARDYVDDGMSWWEALKLAGRDMDNEVR